MRTENQKAWFFVLPVLALVAFNALVPMMTVVNYSVQETFGNNQFFWEGLGWFEQILRSDRFQAALGRQFLFTFLILIIEVPLGIIVALSMPRKGFWVPVCLVLMALPMLIPWNVVGSMWNIFTLPEIGLLGSLQQIRMLAQKLPGTGLPIVLDTVLATTSEGEVLDATARAALLTPSTARPACTLRGRLPSTRPRCRGGPTAANTTGR